MALSGVHITFGYNYGAVPKGGSQAVLLHDAKSSQTMASPTTSTIVAPAELGGGLKPVLTIAASVAIFYVTGPDPDINKGPRRYFDPSTRPDKDIFVNAGDKFAWTTA